MGLAHNAIANMAEMIISVSAKGEQKSELFDFIEKDINHQLQAFDDKDTKIIIDIVPVNPKECQYDITDQMEIIDSLATE